MTYTITTRTPGGATNFWCGIEQWPLPKTGPGVNVAGGLKKAIEAGEKVIRVVERETMKP